MKPKDSLKNTRIGTLLGLSEKTCNADLLNIFLNNSIEEFNKNLKTIEILNLNFFEFFKELENCNFENSIKSFEIKIEQKDTSNNINIYRSLLRNKSLDYSITESFNN